MQGRPDVGDNIGTCIGLAIVGCVIIGVTLAVSWGMRLNNPLPSCPDGYSVIVPWSEKDSGNPISDAYCVNWP